MQVGSVFIFFAQFYSGLAVLLLLGMAGIGAQQHRMRLSSAWIFVAWLSYYLYIGGDTFLEHYLIGFFFLAANSAHHFSIELTV